MIIGISGKARSGKDQFAEYLIDVFSKEHSREFKVTAFAHRLKQMCLEHFNLTREQLWGDRKEEGTEFRKYNTRPFCTGLGKDELPSGYWTPREIMQEIGSFYRKIDYDFWVRKVDEKWKYADCPDLVITDVRHVNECEYVKQNGVLIRVVRTIADRIHGMSHESETALDDREKGYFDIEIANNGTLEDLYMAADNTANAILLLENMRKQGRSYDGEEER